MSNERKIKLSVSKDELLAIIHHHLNSHFNQYTIERSARIHDLTKRLNHDNTPEIEKENINEPIEEKTAPQAPSGW